MCAQARFISVQRRSSLLHRMYGKVLGSVDGSQRGICRESQTEVQWWFIVGPLRGMWRRIGLVGGRKGGRNRIGARIPQVKKLYNVDGMVDM